MLQELEIDSGMLLGRPLSSDNAVPRLVDFMPATIEHLILRVDNLTLPFLQGFFEDFSTRGRACTPNLRQFTYSGADGNLDKEAWTALTGAGVRVRKESKWLKHTDYWRDTPAAAEIW
jgi:hypothetical protein